jgi:alpha-ribazole phosphatase
MTRLWLVRHGPTHARTMVGWTDLPADLSDTDALDRLADYLPAAPVISSDLSRAIATADAIERGRLRLAHDPALREIHFGRWEMRSHADIAAEDPVLIRAFWDEPGAVSAPGGESWDIAHARVSKAVDGYLAMGLPDLIIVAHFGVILTQLQRALRQPAVEVFAHGIANLSVTQLDCGERGWSALSINHCP